MTSQAMFRLSSQLASEAAPVCGTIPCQVILCNNDKLQFCRQQTLFSTVALNYYISLNLYNSSIFHSALYCLLTLNPQCYIHLPSWTLYQEMRKDLEIHYKTVGLQYISGRHTKISDWSCLSVVICLLMYLACYVVIHVLPRGQKQTIVLVVQ